MGINDYCLHKDAELTAWKVKLYDVISRMEQVPGGAREKIYQNVNGVLLLMAELNDRIRTLRKAGPDGWRGQKEEISNKMADLESRYQDTEKALNSIMGKQSG